MTNVVAAQINSQVLVFVIDSSVRVLEAKVRTVSDQLIDLVPSSQANAFSLANLPVGVYTLDVITQKGNAKAAYEGKPPFYQKPPGDCSDGEECPEPPPGDGGFLEDNTGEDEEQGGDGEEESSE